MLKAKLRITTNEIKKVVEDNVRQMRLDIKRNQNEIRTLRSQISTLKTKLKGEE